MLKSHYLSANEHFKQRFGGKTYKLALDGGMTCPNRDGKCGIGGCIFCSEGGSGEFAEIYDGDVASQIERAVKRVENKISEKRFIAYFQKHTNTYAPVDYLENLFEAAIAIPSVVALSIATRPDCLPQDVMRLLERLNKIKPVYVELGLQTIHEDTAKYIRRGYTLDIYDHAVTELKKIGVNVITHVIVGLPGENSERFLQTIDHISEIGTDGVKLQLLHILRNTDIAKDYRQGLFRTLDLEEYAELIIAAVKRLPANIVIHRITGDAPKRLLIAPQWSANKKAVMNYINMRMNAEKIIQGSALVIKQ